MIEIEKIIKNKNYCCDSRIVKKNDIFFDLSSSKYKSGKYLNEALKKNPFKIITENIQFKNNLKYIVVRDVNSFFKKLVIQKFKKKPKYLFAVTGTNGKSSIAYFFYKILKNLKYKAGSVGTLGIYSSRKIIDNNLTTPSFLENHKIFNDFYKQNIKYSIIEASSHGLKQSRLDAFKFYGGIFTNLTRDHLDYHKTFKDYFESKLILFKKHIMKNGFIITNSDTNQFLALKKIADKKKLKILSIGNRGNIIKIISLKQINSFSILKINALNKIYNLKLNLIGKFQIENFLLAVISIKTLGFSFDKIFSNCSIIKNPIGRLQLIEKNKKKVIIDYAHTPDALKKTIQEIKLFFNKEVNLVFGCGGNRDKGKRKLMGLIANKLCKKIYITDDNPRNEDPASIRNEIKKNCPKGVVIPLRKKAIMKSIKDLKNEVLLISGKGHETYQIIKNKKIFFSDTKCVNKYLN